MTSRNLTIKRSRSNHTAAFLYDGDILVASLHRTFEDKATEDWVQFLATAPRLLPKLRSIAETLLTLIPEWLEDRNPTVEELAHIRDQIKRALGVRT